MSESFEQFGLRCSQILIEAPFGSLGKRELELKLLQAAIDTGILNGEIVGFAKSLRLSLSKANAYLTDLALRKPPLTDAEGVAQLMSMLPYCEVVVADRFLSIPLQNSSLRVWLERKLASELLHPGEAVRRDVLKLTPQALLRLLDESDGIGSPSAAIERLGKKLPDVRWAEAAKREWGPKTSWTEALSTFATVISLIEALPTLVSAVMGL
jgi:hypothetical protein